MPEAILKQQSITFILQDVERGLPPVIPSLVQSQYHSIIECPHTSDEQAQITPEGADAKRMCHTDETPSQDVSGSCDSNNSTHEGPPQKGKEPIQESLDTISPFPTKSTCDVLNNNVHKYSHHVLPILTATTDPVTSHHDRHKMVSAYKVFLFYTHCVL